MPITHTTGGTIYTGDSIPYFQAVVQRSAVGLELKGLPVRRGRKVWTRLADHYGIRPRTAQAVYDWLDAKVKELAPQQEHIFETKGGDQS